MATPRGKGLTGSADGAVPGWQERVKSTLNESQAATQKRKKKSRAAMIPLDCDVPFLVMLRQAAESRGMSSSGYARRAVAAFISKDLGIPFPEITKYVSAPYRAGEMLKPDNENGVHMKPGKTFDNGEGFGEWEVK